MYIQEITENVVHESLERRRSIDQPKRHNKPFKGVVAGPKGGFPFIAFHNADQIISVTDINGGIEVGFACSGQEIRNEGKWITVLFGDPVETSEVNTEVEGSILLTGK